MELQVQGKCIHVETVFSDNRNASAKLKGQKITISIPKRWPNHEKERVTRNLIKRSIKALERGRWRIEESESFLKDGLKLTAMGKVFKIEHQPSNRFGCINDGGRIVVKVVYTHPDSAAKASKIARKAIIDSIMPQLKTRVEHYNALHFRSNIPAIRVRDTSSRWGSCSPDGSISLSFRLLFMPQEILDYVIVHELAHTKYRSHGKRFWGVVQSVLPDHKERRRWLRENGWRVPEGCADLNDDGTTSMDDMIAEEPY